MSSSKGAPNIDGMTTLKVDNLSYRTTPEDLKRLFEKSGKVGDIYIPRHPYTKRSRGFAFVRFYHATDAEKATDFFNKYVFNGREMRVQLAKHGRPTESRRRDSRGNTDRRRRSRSRSRSRSQSRRSYSRSPPGSITETKDRSKFKICSISSSQNGGQRSRSRSPIKLQLPLALLSPHSKEDEFVEDSNASRSFSENSDASRSLSEDSDASRSLSEDSDASRSSSVDNE